MKKQGSESSRWHPGITFHKMPVSGAGGLIVAIGIIAITLLGLPEAKWFLAGAVVLGLVVAGILWLFRKIRPKTEIEEVRINFPE